MEHLIQNLNNQEFKNNNHTFDFNFYVKLYPDIIQSGFGTYHKALSHWDNFGKFEGRVCNQDMLNTKLAKTLKDNIEKINRRYISLPNIQHPSINILVRTHSRPELFRTCLNSIYKQNIDCRILVSYDNYNDLDYILEHPDIEPIYLSISSNDKYRFNLYCNHLMSSVHSGWIFFLDDDDMFLHFNSLNIILNNIDNEFDLIIWKFLRTDGEIYPRDINNIRQGEICSCNFCFHSRFKQLSLWPSKKCGDYAFFQNLINTFDFNIKFIPITLTSNIENDKIGNFGK